MSGPSRRSALKAAFAAAALPSVASVALVQDDALMRMIRAYKEECQKINQIEGDVPAGYPRPHLDALAGEAPIPSATTKVSAIAALRLAVEEADGIYLDPFFYNLISAALAYLEQPHAA